MKNELHIYQPNIFDKFTSGTTLSNGEKISGDDFFVATLTLEAQEIAKTVFGCSIKMNEINLASARRYWCRDIENILIRREITKTDSGIEKKTKPNEFKQAGFLAYWLRRRMVVERARRTKTFSAKESKRIQNEFLKNSSEAVAFIIGLRLCTYYRLRPSSAASVPFNLVLKDATPSFSYIMDAVNLMKNKNVSPHALYLIYNSLFRADPTEGIK
jgi:hypothetical protein